MIKTLQSGLLVLVLLLALTACAASAPSEQQKTMYLRRSEFSEETTRVLALLDEELIFFDFSVDDTVKSATVECWVYEDGAWVSEGGINTKITVRDNQIALHMKDDSYSVFIIDESGHSKYTAPEMDFGFENTAQQLSSIADSPTPIVVSEEIPLWVKIGNDKGAIASTMDFRTADCSAGVAFTITFYDTEEP